MEQVQNLVEVERNPRIVNLALRDVSGIHGPEHLMIFPEHVWGDYFVDGKKMNIEGRRTAGRKPG